MTLASGIGNTPIMSEYSVFPNRPNSPWSFKPVKVEAIFQNLMWANPRSQLTTVYFKFQDF